MAILENCSLDLTTALVYFDWLWPARFCDTPFFFFRSGGIIEFSASWLPLRPSVVCRGIECVVAMAASAIIGCWFVTWAMEGCEPSYHISSGVFPFGCYLWCLASFWLELVAYYYLVPPAPPLLARSLKVRFLPAPLAVECEGGMDPWMPYILPFFALTDFVLLADLPSFWVAMAV